MFAQRLDAWMAANKQAAVDRRLLYRMSEHDLRDIGLSHADLRTLHDDWFINRHENTRVTGTLFL